MENVHFFAVIEQMNIRCIFINTVSCDEQHGLYRIVLTYVSDDLVKLSVSYIYTLVAIYRNHGVTLTTHTRQRFDRSCGDASRDAYSYVCPETWLN